MVLRQFERDAVLACLALAALAAVAGGLGACAGVLGGGGLAALSYRGLKAGVYGGIGPATGRGFALVKFFTRYAILAVAAYVMLARLRLPAWAVAAGVSSLAVALGVAVARTFGSSRQGNSR
jgi:hypothetical protein